MEISSASPKAVQGTRGTRAGTILLAGLGAFLALSAVGAMGTFTGQAWVLGSFGASSVLLFGFPGSPFSRTRNVLGGHVLSSLIGLCFLQWLGPGWPAMAGAAACALMVMMATDTVHPPAGSNPIIIFMSHADWTFLAFPTLAGALLLLLAQRIYRGVVRQIAQE